MVCGAKRIRSHYLLLDGRQASRTLEAISLQGRASPYTINGATMRLCRVDHPAPHRSIAAARSAELRVPPVPSLSRGACRGRSRSHSVPPHRAYSSGRRTAISAVAAGDSCIVRARSNGFVSAKPVLVYNTRQKCRFFSERRSESVSANGNVRRFPLAAGKKLGTRPGGGGPRNLEFW